MGNNAVKTIVLIMGLVVMSVLIGAQISDSVENSVGAFATIGVVVGLFGMLFIGKDCWKLIFLIPPFTRILPLHLPIPLMQAIGIAVGAYWLIMRGMGYVRYKWHSLLLMDFFVLVLSLYMVANFYEHPVAVSLLGIDYEYVGGRDYLAAAVAVFYYLSLSTLPLKLEELLKCLKWMICLDLGLAFISGCLGVSGVYMPQGMELDAGEVIEHGRFSYFSSFGMLLAMVVFCFSTIPQLISSLWRMGLFLFGSLGVLLSGGRTLLFFMGIKLIFLSCVKRESLVLILFGCIAYGGLLLTSAAGALNGVPYGVQRVLTVLPGVSVSEEVLRDANISSDIRVKMWKNALDPRTGLIKDYIWGDGFQVSRSMLSRTSTAKMRGIVLDFQKELESTGTWHNGWVSYLQHLGIVGLILLQIFALLGVFFLFRTARVLIQIPLGGYAVLAMIDWLSPALTSAFLVWEVSTYFHFWSSLGLMKLLHCLLQEKGLMPPIWSRQHYVPLLIREMQQTGGVR